MGVEDGVHATGVDCDARHSFSGTCIDSAAVTATAAHDQQAETTTENSTEHFLHDKHPPFSCACASGCCTMMLAPARGHTLKVEAMIGQLEVVSSAISSLDLSHQGQPVRFAIRPGRRDSGKDPERRVVFGQGHQAGEVGTSILKDAPVREGHRACRCPPRATTACCGSVTEHLLAATTRQALLSRNPS